MVDRMEHMTGDMSSINDLLTEGDSDDATLAHALGGAQAMDSSAAQDSVDSGGVELF